MYSFVVLGLPDGMIGTAWPALRRGFHVPLEDLGVVLLVGTLGALASSSVSGLVLARLGIRSTVMTAGAIAGLGATGMVLAPAFWAFVLAGTAIGVAAGLLDSAVNTAVALAGRNRLLNLLHGCYGVGTTIGPLVVTAAVLAGSWRPAYGVLLAVEAALVGGWWLFSQGWRPSRTGPGGGPARPGPGGGPARTGGGGGPAELATTLAPPGLSDDLVNGRSVGATASSGSSGSPVPPLGGMPVGGPTSLVASPGGPTSLVGVPVGGPTSLVASPGGPTAASVHRRPRVVGVVALGLLVFALYTGFEVAAGQWEPSFDRGPLHLGAGATGLATFGYWGALTLARFALAVPRRPIAPSSIVRWGCAVALAGAGLVWWRPSTVVALVGLLVIGAALAGVFPALVLLTPARVGDDMAQHVIGWQIGAAGLGGSAISAGCGAVFQRFGLTQFGPALVAAGAALLVGVLALERAASAMTKPGPDRAQSGPVRAATGPG